MSTAFITGTTKGLGFELLKVFLENNWKVFALVRNAENIKHLQEQFPETCFPVIGDVTNDEVTKDILHLLQANTEKIDLLINNAGNAVKCFGFDNVTPELLDEHFKVHVSGAFRIIKTCMPFLQKSENPIIINISSRKGSIHKINSGAYRILFPYQIAKAAQNMLTACLNQEFKDTNIKPYAIHPGNLKTDVAPPDADTEPFQAAEKIYRWVINPNKLSTEFFYSVMDDSVLDW